MLYCNPQDTLTKCYDETFVDGVKANPQPINGPEGRYCFSMKMTRLKICIVVTVCCHILAFKCVLYNWMLGTIRTANEMFTCICDGEFIILYLLQIFSQH